MFEDADLDEALRIALIFTARTGQGCTIPSRLLVQDSIYDAFLDWKAHRDISVKAGQFFVPFDRLRTVREFALQMGDRPRPVAELTLDRDYSPSEFPTTESTWLIQDDDSLVGFFYNFDRRRSQYL